MKYTGEYILPTMYSPRVFPQAAGHSPKGCANEFFCFMGQEALQCFGTFSAATARTRDQSKVLPQSCVNRMSCTTHTSLNQTGACWCMTSPWSEIVGTKSEHDRCACTKNALRTRKKTHQTPQSIGGVHSSNHVFPQGIPLSSRTFPKRVCE